MLQAVSRYSNVAIALHWVIALLVIGQIALIMGVDAKGPNARTFAELHKADGILLMVLTLARLGWRIGHKPPPLADMPRWQAFAARATQVLFYVLLLVFPLTGWISLSMFARPIDMYGLFDWPVLPIRGDRADAIAVMDIHRAGAKLLYVLLFLHIAGALKHHFIDKDHTLRSMLPARR